MIDQKQIDALYDEAFFAYANSPEDPVSRARHLALGDAIHAVIRRGASVCDLGCGPGLGLPRLRELGHDAVGCEGSTAGVHLARLALGARSVDHVNLTRPPAPASAYVGWDVVVCTEVAEHIPEDAADLVVDHVMARIGRAHSEVPPDRIVWSAAPPGQPGTDHCNCQPPEYWLEKFAARGWVPSSGPTDILRAAMVRLNTAHCEYATNFYVLVPR